MDELALLITILFSIQTVAIGAIASIVRKEVQRNRRIIIDELRRWRR